MLVSEELEQLLLQKLPERDTVEAYQIIEELPFTLIGKVDYRALEQWGEKESTFI